MKKIGAVILLAAGIIADSLSAKTPKEVSAEHGGYNERYCADTKIKILFLGDSITDKCHVGCTKNYWGFLADKYGFSPLVYGVNGHQWSHIPGQIKAYMKDHGQSPDVVFVFAGTNDFNSNVPLGEWYRISECTVNKNGKPTALKKREMFFDAASFRGRINIAMHEIRKVFPSARIVLLTPIHRGYAKFSANNIQPDESYSNERGLFIDDYVKVIKEAGNLWAAKVVDINADSGLYPNIGEDAPFFANKDTDRLHPSTLGHKRIAEAISLSVGEFLK